MIKYMRKLCDTQEDQNTLPVLPLSDPKQFGKIWNKIAHRVDGLTDPYTPKNTAKWARMLIKAALLLDFNDIAYALESLSELQLPSAQVVKNYYSTHKEWDDVDFFPNFVTDRKILRHFIGNSHIVWSDPKRLRSFVLLRAPGLLQYILSTVPGNRPHPVILR